MDVEDFREKVIEILQDNTDHWRDTQSTETVAVLERITEQVRTLAVDDATLDIGLPELRPEVAASAGLVRHIGVDVAHYRDRTEIQVIRGNTIDPPDPPEHEHDIGGEGVKGICRACRQPCNPTRTVHLNAMCQRKSAAMAGWPYIAPGVDPSSPPDAQADQEADTNPTPPVCVCTIQDLMTAGCQCGAMKPLADGGN